MLMKIQSQNEICLFWDGSEKDIIIVGIQLNALNSGSE